MNPTGGRPVVVNSLLCFLKNYREQSNILQIIDQYFTLESRRLSYQILLELLSETDRMTVASSPCTPSLLELFDRVLQSDALIPVFAADDLTILPLSLNYDNGNEQPKDLYNEVRQLRLYVHNALGQKTYNPALWKRQNNQFDFNPQNMKSPHLTPSLKQKSPTVNDFNVSSLLKNDRENVQCSPTSSSSSTSSEINPVSMVQKPLQQQRRSTTRPRKQLKSLDKAVQKLTDRLLKTENNNNEECHFENNNEFEHKNEESTRENNNNTIASAFGSSAAAITAQFIQNFTNQAFENGRLPNALLATSNSTGTHFSELPQDNNEDMDKEMGAEFGHENEKTSSQSSPTPSEMSRDCLDSANDADKPYVCSQFNCRKRFSNKFLLKKHQFIHTGLKPHTCPFCMKTFNRKDNLLRHKKTHLNNALGQMSGRKRHNALTGVSEESFNLFNQVNNLMDSKNFQFGNEDSNDANHLNSFNEKLNEESMDDEA